MPKAGSSKTLTQVRHFLQEHEGTMTARYYNREWHIVIMWDDGYRGQYYEVAHPYFNEALLTVWERSRNRQEAIANSRT